jgi:hypothetical protein
MKTREQILERAQKLKALASRGVGGEKDNAARMLKEYQAAHGISDDEINENFFITTVITWFKITEKLTIMSCFEIMGGHLFFMGREYREDKEANKIFVNLTREERDRLKRMFYPNYKRIYSKNSIVTIE